MPFLRLLVERIFFNSSIKKICRRKISGNNMYFWKKIYALDPQT